ncbi:hypothetical protein [Anoxybacillus flavithermus]|uniref:hypothetical protein n=1 Tax=Anoxybacillus flavithermus TaxID=33934 RepID=UPI0005A18BB8|nr:hypothetical protein [Anoxybacillus flavithermus]
MWKNLVMSVINFVRNFKKDSFREIAKPAIKRISYEMKVNMITEQEIAEFIYREEPYLGYLYFEAGYDISILIITRGAS